MHINLRHLRRNPPVFSAGTAPFTQRLLTPDSHCPKRPFKHAQAIFAAIQTAMSLPTLAEQVAAMAQVPEYKSRGHGGRRRTSNRLITGRWATPRSKYNPLECARSGHR